MDKDEKVELLRGVPLFGGCAQRDLGRIGRLFDEMTPFTSTKAVCFPLLGSFFPSQPSQMNSSAKR